VLTKEKELRFEMHKEGLRRLLGAGASSPEEAADLVARITRIARDGTKLEVETMIVWPEDQPDARPASEFFVNERIDLLVREAESFRNDYRNLGQRNVFLALRKPLPFANLGSDPEGKAEPLVDSPKPKAEGAEGIETMRYCGAVLMLIVLGCGAVSAFVLTRQNRRTR
jgi:hypothetical protein